MSKAIDLNTRRKRWRKAAYSSGRGEKVNEKNRVKTLRPLLPANVTVCLPRRYVVPPSNKQSKMRERWTVLRQPPFEPRLSLSLRSHLCQECSFEFNLSFARRKELFIQTGNVGQHFVLSTSHQLRSRYFTRARLRGPATINKMRGCKCVASALSHLSSKPFTLTRAQRSG